MKHILISAFLVITAQIAYAQSTQDILVSGAMDVVKTDIQKPVNKAQIGLEANYFIQRHFAMGVGLEIWTQQKNSFVMGARWYAKEDIFIRFRGLIGVNDASLGVGWSKALNETWRLETIGDFYFNSPQFALRIGASYIIKKK